MLVLSRKSNESIVINNNIKVTVVEIRGDKVRLGIEAPKNIPVHREEIYNQINGQPNSGGAVTPSENGTT
ncbi:carbon storage regulator CsrA [bacterium]|jgi:carbon storage regulator|nr:carbon storage regulator CsrA [bacterium]